MNQAFLSGLGYVVLEGPDALIEWGFHNARDNKDARSIRYVSALLARYKPDVLVLEEYNGRQRSPRIQTLADEFSKLARDCGTQVYRIPRPTVRATLSSKNKYVIAGMLAERFPELKPFCPPRRKIWRSEDPRINIFDALALAWASIAVWTRDDDGRVAATGV